VYRYRTEDGVDGLAGEEGTFLLYTSGWRRRSRWPIRSIERGQYLSAPLRSPTISAC